ncbi:MAG TPA: GAF domain-containing protein [Anaerolineae bacterium]|nr:GAF domain-containing protein [Anaerolineae bacterium]HQH37068.1 GAF domain-containing protein [Anaerolineae bacterium]
MEKDNIKSTDRRYVPLAEDIVIWRQQLIRRVLQVMLVFGGLMLTAGSYSAYSRGVFWAIGVYIGVYGVLVVLTLWRRAPYTLQVAGIQLILYTLAVVVFITRGLGDSSRVYLLTMVFVSTLFWGWRATLFTLGLVIATMMGMAWAFTGGYLVAQEVVSTDWSAWIPLSIEVLSMGVFIMVLLSSYTARFNAYVMQSRELAQALEENRADLAQQVAQRTSDLEKRTRQLEAATAVAREAATIQDVEALLERAVQLVSDRFGFYHTGIFLTDEAGEYAVLRAASSEEGQRLLARAHRLKVGEVGVVGYVTRQGEPRIAQDVRADALYYANPEMPATRSEMALPLLVRGRVIGALDVQSVEPEAFTQDDVDVLQALADQLAIAIEDARLIAASQAALETAQRAYGEISRVAWQEMLRTHERLGARYDPHHILPSDAVQPEVTKPDARQSTAGIDARVDTLSVPLKARGQVIGELAAYVPGDQPWTADQRELLETLGEQLSVALESARLYEDTQRRAARERMISEVTGRIRETLDIEAVLKTAAEQMCQALALKDLVVRLVSPEAVKMDVDRTEHKV